MVEIEVGVGVKVEVVVEVGVGAEVVVEVEVEVTWISEIQDRVDAATAGPWLASDSYGSGSSNLIISADDDFIADTGQPEDANFIANARSDVPRLLAEITRLTRERDESMAVVKSLRREVT